MAQRPAAALPVTPWPVKRSARRARPGWQATRGVLPRGGADQANPLNSLVLIPEPRWET